MLREEKSLKPGPEERLPTGKTFTISKPLTEDTLTGHWWAVPHLKGSCLGMNSCGLYLNLNLLGIPEMDFGSEGVIVFLCLSLSVFPVWSTLNKSSPTFLLIWPF